MYSLIVIVATIISYLQWAPVTDAQQLVSPCPRLFSYEPQKENDRWYGVVTLISDSDLQGVWLRLIFDKPSLQLGNWFGEVVIRNNNQEYLVKNPMHEIKANMPYALRFFVKYNPAESPPQLKEFRLNAKVVCPEGGGTTASSGSVAQLQTSGPLEATPGPPPVQTTTEFIRPGGGWFPQEEKPSSGEDNDFFQGDFALFGHQKPRPPSNQNRKIECGTVVIHPTPLISHGQATKEGEFPWHTALYYAKGIDLTYICGASLVSYRHVLTVAHCATKKSSANALDPDNIVVYLGKHYLRRWSNPGIQDSHVSKIIIHPQYDASKYVNDIAILELAKDVEFTDYVRPICLWSDTKELDPIVNKLGTVVGWGIDERGRITEQLTQAKMPVVKKETCIYSFPDFFSRYTTDKSYCAGFRNGTSVCNGDSGGGMVFPKITPGNNRQVWQLRGLVSISVALQNQFTCDASHYVVFTDVAKYLDWIQAAMV